MEKSLMLISEQSEYLVRICDVLHRSKVDWVQTETIAEAKAGLQQCSPAFILLDFAIKGSDFLLHDISLGGYCLRPYIMVAADYASGDDRAAMLKRGADYCIEKPVNANELLAVIESVLRRSRPMNTIIYKEMVICKSNRTVTMRGKPVQLTRKEYDVLCVLASHVGEVLTKEEIYRAAWKSSYNSKSTNVSDQISSLRGKLGFRGKGGTYIHTVIGVGYRFGENV